MCHIILVDRLQASNQTFFSLAYDNLFGKKISEEQIPLVLQKKKKNKYH